MKVAYHCNRKRAFLVFTLTAALIVFCQSVSQATIFWDDEMESGNSGYGLPSNGAMSYDTSIKFSGNGSTRLNYPSSCYPDASAQQNCGGFMDRTFTSTANFYRRFYIRLSAGFRISDVFTKIMRSDTTGPNSNWWVMGCCGSPEFLVSAQNVPSVGNAVNYKTNFDFTDSKWYCVETHEQLNTPGVANGIAQAWVDGALVMSVTNIIYRQAGDNSLFNNNRLYRQTGTGSIWYDRVAVGDQRIGCTGSSSLPPATSSPSPTSPPPASPTGLTVR